MFLEQLELFFSSGNDWDFDKVKKHSYPEPLSTHLSDMLNKPINGTFPFILPRIDASKGLWFYVCTKDALQLNEVNNMIQAFLGSSFIVRDPLEYKDSQDTNEQIILSVCPHGFSRFYIPKALNKDKNRVYWVFESLNKLINLYHERPNLLSTIKRPIGTILRSFFTACNHHNGYDAYNYYLELKKQQSLSNRNILSLEFQALYASRSYSEILNHTKFQDVISVTVPKLLQSLFLKTVLRYVLKNIDFTSNDIEEVQRLLLPFRNLFFFPPEISDSRNFQEEWKCWIIGKVAFDQSKTLTKVPSCIDNSWLDNMYKWAGISLGNVDIIDQIPVENNFYTLLDQDPSFDIGKNLLVRSIDLTSDEKKEIFKRLINYPEDIFNQLIAKPPISYIWQDLKEQSEESVEFRSWNDLLKALSNSDLDGYDFSIQSISNDSMSWKYLEELIPELNKLILEINTLNANLTLRDILPLFLNWIELNEAKLSIEALEHLIMTLAMDDSHVKEDLLLCSSIFSYVMEQAHTKAQYVSILEAIVECWDSTASVSSIDIAIGVFEEILDSPCLCNNTQLLVWSNIERFTIKHWTRLSEIQKILIKDISSILMGTTDHLPSVTHSIEAIENTVIDLRGKRLAIYTLTESAARRASQILERMYPGLEVKTNSDKSATEALTSLIKSADYFIFAARSAAHQAFYPLTSSRKDIIYPGGKGSSSIIRAMVDFLKAQ